MRFLARRGRCLTLHERHTVHRRHDGGGRRAPHAVDLAPTSFVDLAPTSGPARELVMVMPEPRTDTLANEDARRALQHGSVKSNVVSDVNAEIAGRVSEPPPPAAARKIEAVAGTFRDHAVDDVVDSERAVRRSRGVARLSQFIDYAFFLIYALLAIRFVLVLVAARSTSGFVQFIASVTDPFYAPFKGIVASTEASPGHTLMLPLLVALGAYVVLHVAINRLLRLVTLRKTAI